jgi:hypothetical protein
MKEINDILEQINNLVLSDTHCSEYRLESTQNMIDAMHITEIKLNMYQLWAMFGELPKVCKKGENVKVYEYTIRGKNKDIFTIYAHGHENGFVKTKHWNIGATTNDTAAIQHFMDHLFLALRLYSEHYKCMENNIFESRNEEIDMHLKKIKRELIENKDAIKGI